MHILSRHDPKKTDNPTIDHRTWAHANPNVNSRQSQYPTRLRKPLDRPWLRRRESVVRGRALEGPLNTTQLDEFERKGFLFEPDFLGGHELDALRQELAAQMSRTDFQGREFTVTEPNGQEIRSLFAVHFLSDLFARLAQDERLRQRVQQILGGDAYVHQSRINYKPGFEGKGFNWHSDFETWHAEDGMPAMHAVSASIVLTENHHFNGPLMLIPGSHRLLDRKSTRLNSSHVRISYAVFC